MESQALVPQSKDNQKLTLQFEGTEDNNSLRFEALIKKLGEIQDVLEAAEKAFLGEEKSFVYYLVTRINMNSPINLFLERKPKPGVELPSVNVPELVVQTIMAVQNRTEVRREVNNDMLEALKKVFTGQGIQNIIVGSGEEIVRVESDIEQKITAFQGPTRHEHNTITGKLDAINFHNPKAIFYIYPTIKRGKIRCICDEKIAEEAVAALRKRVRVRGKFSYNDRSRLPYLIEVQGITVMPEDSKLADIDDLFGITSGFFDGPQNKDFGRLDNDW